MLISALVYALMEQATVPATEEKTNYIYTAPRMCTFGCQKLQTRKFTINCYSTPTMEPDVEQQVTVII